MPTKGYDDADNIARIRRLMADGETSRRQAIISVVGVQNLRRIEMKMRRLEMALAADPEEDPEARRRAAIAADHALTYPARLQDDDEGLVFEVFAPGAGPSRYPDGTPCADTRTRFVFRAGAGMVDGCAVGRAMTWPARSELRAPYDDRVSADQRDAAAGLEALGLSHEVVDGVIGPRQGTSDAVRRLAEALAAAWEEDGGDGPFMPAAPDEDLLLLAVEVERERLERAGLAKVRDAIDPRILCLAATLSDPAMENWAGKAADKLKDGPGLRAIYPLVPFLHGVLYILSPKESARYEGRPRELLARHLRDWVVPSIDSPAGGSLTDREIDWLLKLFGDRPIPPLGSFAIDLLLSQRHAIDERRAATLRDAAGLAAIFRALSERRDGHARCVGDWQLRLDAAYVMGRLNEGPDAALPFGEVAARLAEAGADRTGRAADRQGAGDRAPDPIAVAVTRLLRARDIPLLVLDRLVMPTVASAVSQAHGLSAEEAEVRVRGMYRWSYQLFPEQALQVARDMTVSGVDVAGLSRLGLEAERCGLDGDPGGTRYGGVVRSAPIGEACDYEWKYPARVEREWHALSSILVPRWQFEGPDLMRVAMAGWIRRAGEPDAASRRSIREFVAGLWPARMFGRTAA